MNDMAVIVIDHDVGDVARCRRRRGESALSPSCSSTRRLWAHCACVLDTAAFGPPHVVSRRPGWARCASFDTLAVGSLCCVVRRIALIRMKGTGRWRILHMPPPHRFRGRSWAGRWCKEAAYRVYAASVVFDVVRETEQGLEVAGG